jgi:hypothetical protein
MDDVVESKYESYKTENKIFSKRSPGRSLSLGYNIKFQLTTLIFVKKEVVFCDFYHRIRPLFAFHRIFQ